MQAHESTEKLEQVLAADRRPSQGRRTGIRMASDTQGIALDTINRTGPDRARSPSFLPRLEKSAF
ncbi:MAG: hypothetical protein D6690_05830 [Nitrospirae bacterium]|nr:MAG: hypothetical protein D6690_05830 [Nitrospirota bacterium]